MEEANQSVVHDFIFQGLCNSKELQIFLFLSFSILYLMTVVGNLFVVLLIITDPHLHSPMYFLLANLSLVDFCLSSVTTPKLTTDLLKDKKTISFGGCMCQILCVHFFAGNEMVLLVTMAYDLLKLACMDTNTLGMLINADSGILATTCFIVLLISYTYILVTVRLHSEGGASKALSTCTSHITVVVLFFGPCIFIYLWPVSTSWVDKFLAVFYTVITPLLNPAIYTLRNNHIKKAVKKLVNQHVKSME
ncbi:Olfactory receptor 4K3 [Sciurus carolinensis]|uniref:Olfactory receptor 4K3 n=1 Tax=Sciurus carolinensis TaxID=30640 RepID=A0AA41NFH2_SCICA|nr:Olfactory receptor 4K3 [Sciurus carolinensis]